MNFRKLSVFLSILALSVFAVSCAEEKPVYRIGVSQCSGDEWRQQLNSELRREILFYPGATVEIVDAADDNAKQIADIEKFIQDGVDVLVVAPNEAEAICPVIEKAYDMGIPVVLVDRKINSEKYTAYVGADNYDVGYRAGEYVASRLASGGRVVEIVGMITSTPAQERHHGFVEALKEHKGITVDVLETDWTYESSFDAYKGYLSDAGPADLVFAHNDRMASAAREVADTFGCADNTLFVGVDALTGKGLGVEMVNNGVLAASFIYPTGGDRVAQVAMDILQGTPYSRESLLSTELVNSANARIMLMQNAQITTLDEKITMLDEKLDSSMVKYSYQRKLLWLIVAFLAIIFLLLCVAVYGFRKMLLMNRILEDQKKQIEEQREAKLAFFTNVSHDFRTPLTLISDPVEQLKKNGSLNDKDRFLLDLIYKNVTVLRRLVNQILDFRKYESGKLDIRLSEFDMATALKDWADSFMDLAWRKHITLTLNVEPSCVGLRVVADMEKMERIAYNLLSNAFKFTPERGTIDVNLGLSEDGSLLWSVTDSGVGLSEEHIEHIFENFYQVSSVHHSGSGIGLALVKVFVEMQSGEISVSSRKGNGTNFSMKFPVRQNGDVIQPVADKERMEVMRNGAKCDAGQQTVASDVFDPSHERNDDGKESVLIIDDNSDVREYLRSLLGGYYYVMEASNGEEGFRVAAKRVPDAIICDVMMPVMDGMECCRKLKSDVQTSHIPVMMLTAYTAENQKIEGYECGADSYISKPFSAELLMARLKNLLESRSRLQSIFGDSLSLGKEKLPETDKDFVSRLRHIIHESMSDSQLSVEVIGDRMCMSRVQLYRKTKALTGYSPNEYLRIARLKKAMSLLDTTDMTVSEVAHAVGFSTSSYFAKCYKEYFGENPTDRKS